MKQVQPLPHVTDHALVRWLERVHGMDMEGFRKQLGEVVAPYVAIGARRVTIEGFAYEFDRNVLCTVQPAKTKNGKRRLRSNP